MPAHNEAEGISEFLAEIYTHVQPLPNRVTFVVADDRSTDNTVETLTSLTSPHLVVTEQPVNRGHGPDALVPHVHFSLAEARWGLDKSDVAVKSIPRRGTSQTGTMWGKEPLFKLPSKRLLRFVWHACKEVWT